MSVPVVVIMPGIINAIVPVHFFYGAAHDRVGSGASDTGGGYRVIIVHIICSITA